MVATAKLVLNREGSAGNSNRLTCVDYPCFHSPKLSPDTVISTLTPHVMFFLPLVAVVLIKRLLLNLSSNHPTLKKCSRIDYEECCIDMLCQ